MDITSSRTGGDDEGKETSLEGGFRRYKAYVRHANKHDLLERLIHGIVRDRVGTVEQLDVLDVGAGSGRLTRAVVDSGQELGMPVRVVALEPCVAAAAEMRKTCAVNGQEDVQIELREVGLEEQSRIASERFDLLIAAHVSYYFDDLDAFLSQLRSIAKPGGELLLVGTSVSIMQNRVYQTILRKLRSRDEFPRTFHMDGNFTFAEDIELALVRANLRYARSVLRSSIIFCPEDINQTLTSLRAPRPDCCGPVIQAMAFLWRYPCSALMAFREDWVALLEQYGARGASLVLDYEDLVYRATV